MEKNEINIINDLDKENDDLMTHLGILQQLSLGQKTNVLKEIKSYKDDSLDNNKSKKINNMNSLFSYHIPICVDFLIAKLLIQIECNFICLDHLKI